MTHYSHLNLVSLMTETQSSNNYNGRKFTATFGRKKIREIKSDDMLRVLDSGHQCDRITK